MAKLIASYERVVGRAPSQPGSGGGNGGTSSLPPSAFSAFSSASASAGSSPTPSSTVGVPNLFLISGYSGVGKSSLVDELHKHVLRHRGLFAAGKFDLYKRDSSCLLQAFRQLVVQLLVTDAPLWRAKISAALGANGAVMCDVLPELGKLLGPQPRVSRLSAAEMAARFQLVFGQFVAAIATETSPLTLFIDDLQVCHGGARHTLVQQNEQCILAHRLSCMCVL